MRRYKRPEFVRAAFPMVTDAVPAFRMPQEFHVEENRGSVGDGVCVEPPEQGKEGRNGKRLRGAR